MEIKETIVDRFGRIVIPKKIRDDFNLEAGTQIRFEESDEGIVLKPVRGEPNLRWKNGVLVFSGTPLDDLSNVLAKHREERSRSILKP
jgi:AbrB family looped-hinge helix DNA binding protein